MEIKKYFKSQWIKTEKPHIGEEGTWKNKDLEKVLKSSEVRLRDTSEWQTALSKKADITVFTVLWRLFICDILEFSLLDHGFFFPILKFIFEVMYCNILVCNIILSQVYSRLFYLA